MVVTIGLVGGIPTGSNIVELDAVDGKNVFYLPKDSFYTAIMTSGELFRLTLTYLQNPTQSDVVLLL